MDPVLYVDILSTETIPKISLINPHPPHPPPTHALHLHHQPVPFLTKQTPAGPLPISSVLAVEGIQVGIQEVAQVVVAVEMGDR